MRCGSHRDKIEACSALLVIMTPAAARSRWVAREIQEAESLGKPIMPLLLRGRVFFELNDTQYEDVRDGDMPRRGDLLTRLRALHAPPVPPRPWAQTLSGRLGERLTVGDPGRAFMNVRSAFAADGTAPPDTAIDGGSFGDLEIRGASVRGHRNQS